MDRVKFTSRYIGVRGDNYTSLVILIFFTRCNLFEYNSRTWLHSRLWHATVDTRYRWELNIITTDREFFYGNVSLSRLCKNVNVNVSRLLLYLANVPLSTFKSTNELCRVALKIPKRYVVLFFNCSRLMFVNLYLDNAHCRGGKRWFFTKHLSRTSVCVLWFYGIIRLPINCIEFFLKDASEIRKIILLVVSKIFGGKWIKIGINVEMQQRVRKTWIVFINTYT